MCVNSSEHAGLILGFFLLFLSDGKNASGSKQRYNRKRETSYSKNENFSSQSRRSSSQKSKAFNKMPPQRGGSGGSGKLFSSCNGGRRDEVRIVMPCLRGLLAWDERITLACLDRSAAFSSWAGKGREGAIRGADTSEVPECERNDFATSGVLSALRDLK